MAFGILEDHKLDNVPGTGLLSAKVNQVTVHETRELKRGTGKHSHIVLIPQPSGDPRDPLNWSRWKKEACFWTLIFATTLAAALNSPASAGYGLLARKFHESVDEVASSFSAAFLGIAIFMLVQIGLASKYGLRLMFLLSSFLDLSWQLGFWFAGLAGGVCFVGVFFLVPETTYHREGYSEHTKVLDADDKDSIKKTARTPATQDTEMQKPGLNAPTQPSFLSQLKIYNGTFSDESAWKIFARPFPFVLSPVTWFMFLSITSLCLSTIFTITDHFKPTQIGLIHLAGLVGSVIALLMTGPLNDRTIVWISQRNRGIYEPEYRLVFLLALLFGVFGYAGWAIGIDKHMPWIGAAACIAMINMSLTVGGGASTAYLLDTHGANAMHVLSLINSARDLLLYGATFFANGFIVSRGIKMTLAVLAICQSVALLASIMMYVYGKRVRSFVARHPRLFHGDLPISDCSQSAAPVAETDSKH
ncbi:MFS general substrate transporter [Ganoderma sinense ZZ0214-1]|uniref:MFS general substrate transporter n=1 Tax=Ganoderma sinense ZZ0214-1 TaxID=1077348 RepID=A0A2G8SRU9_9APHY|nr:MFS general substrate transporter [Ganoderma sinense ZZ0214-1]